MRARLAAAFATALLAGFTTTLSAQTPGWHARTRSTAPAVPADGARWYHNASQNAWDTARQAGKPLLLVIVGDGPISKQFVSQVLTAPQFDRLAGSVVLAYAEASVDSEANKVLEKLNVDRVPHVVLVAPSGDGVEIVAQHHGFVTADSLVPFLEQKLAEHGYVQTAGTTTPRCGCRSTGQSYNPNGSSASWPLPERARTARRYLTVR